MNISNNTILITGGTSGLGLEFTRQLVDWGNTVLVTGRDLSKLGKTKKIFPQVHIFQSDVSDPKAIRELYERVITQFPNLNVLINNAGEMRKINLHDVSYDLENITREIEINLSGPIRMVQQFLPHLKTQKAAAILNVTSGIALIPFPISPIYGASKSGLRSYTKSLRIQMKNTSVKVFELVAPGAKTPLNDKFEKDVDPKTLMDPGKLVAIAIKGIENDTLDIYPGLAKLLKIASRVAPGFLLQQLSKPVDKMQLDQ
ncbi:short-chain dehydrogenase [Adhaeribacter arboris]|uniref:Short-chain dehydrogenase n=1 Tax=Adhaeribacter arboris TaxID=2072846 RepID=A0A2T2YI05_9BACT|nr:SDR family NAD(P)-dependent oxidoreductase [Adhaeribacter arboris]PSR55137.1 short-chain dehydrogenase [Adhaeribacter arboris]